jgi:hypothetical protein
MSHVEPSIADVSARPLTTIVFGLLTVASLVSAGIQLSNNAVVLGAISLFGAAAWGTLTRSRLTARVRIEDRTVTAIGHLEASIGCHQIGHVSLLKSSRVSYDVSIKTVDGTVHRLATHLSRRSAEHIDRTIRHAFRQPLSLND